MKVDWSTFISDFVTEKRLTNYNANIIPLKADLSINISHPKNYKEVDLCIYQRLIGKLIYLVYDTRPDIIFTVGQLSRHNADPRKRYLQAVKRVVRYLKGIINMGLIFG